MKNLKKVTIILTIVLICLVSFGGIYVKKQNRMENIIKDYDLGMNLSGHREIRMKVADKQEVTTEKIQEVKDLLLKRLKELGARDYLIRVDEVAGHIVLELEENDRTDKIVGDIYASGILKLVDSEDESKVLMTNDDVKQVALKYSTQENGTVVYLDIEFTEEGSKKIEDLTTNQYKTLEKEEAANTETKESSDEKKEEVKQPKMTLKIDDTTMISSSFDTPVTSGNLQLSLNSATTDTKVIQDAVNSGVAISTIINNGPLPIKYELIENSYIYSEITENTIMVFEIAIAIIVVIAFVILSLKYKTVALLAGMSYVGFVAVYLLVLRYANVTITLEGVVAILIIMLINYLLTQKILKKDTIWEAIKEMYIQLIPVMIVIIVFSFINWTSIASFGMIMFWGLILTVLYHFTVTKALIQKK